MNLKDEYTILIVDDSLSDRGRYGRYLEEDKSFKYQILEADSLENGLKLWKQQSPDVMLVNLDINWPGGSGLELLDAIKKTDSRQKLPIIVISGQGNERIAVQAMRKGASDYLSKGDITAPCLSHCIKNIIEQQGVWEKLEASEKRFTHLADTAPVGIFRTDAVGNCLYVNQRWSQITGLSYEKALGQGWSQALYIEDREAIAAEWYASTEECRPFKMEYRFQRPDGTITWVFGESSAERDNNGEIIGYLGTITDISDRKWAELTLQKLISGTASVTGENFFPALVQNLAEVLNVSYALVTELVADQLHTLEFWANGALQPAISYHAAHTPCGVALREGEFYCQAHIQELFPEDLDLVTMQAESYIGVALKDDLGNAIGTLCILDIKPLTKSQRIEEIAILQVFAARAAAELLRQQADKALYQLNQELEAKIEERTAALQASESFNRGILETIPDLLLHLKRDGTCLNYIEPKINKERFLPISKHISEILPPDDLENTLQNIEQAIATKELQVYEHQLLKNGCLTDEEIRVLALNDQEVLVIVRDISDRKRSEEALKISEERFRNAFDTTAVGMSLVSTEGRFIKVNPSLCLFWGYSEAELLELTFQDITHPDDLTIDLELVRQLLAGEIDHYNLEKRYFTKNQQLVWGYLSVSLVRDTKNQPLYFVSQVQDITQRKQAEESLRRSESRFRLMFDSNVVGMLFADFQGHVIDANDCFLNIIGYTREELDANKIDWFALTPPEHLAQDFMCMEHLKKYGEISPWEKEYYHKDGHRVAILIGAAYLTDSRDETICVVIDISDRKRAEEELKKSRTQFQRLVDDMGEKFVVFSYTAASGILQYVSDGITSVFGIKKEDVLGNAWTDVVNWVPEDQQNAIDNLIHTLNGEVGFNQQEMRFIHPDGSIRTISISDHPVKNEAGEIVAIEGIVEDITDRKNNEIKLQNANLELERLLKLREETLTFREDMSNMIIHDLRNPLTAMMLSAEVLLKYSDRADNRSVVTKQAKRMLQAGKHITEMIDSLLYMAKLESGKIILNPTLTDLHQLSLSILSEFQLIKKSQNIELTSQLPAPGTHILIDSIILRRVIENLLSNALKFSPPQSQIHLNIEHLPADHLRIQVADNGPGIDPDTYDKIFGKFETGQVQQDVSQIGLGLAFCKMAVEAHGGTIAIAPNQPKGSIFTVEI
ncbi:MAG: PAS domain S-box protein [Snowella sp.]|nr:PAS domain S-box protein [Snowella sp.]